MLLLQIKSVRVCALEPPPVWLVSTYTLLLKQSILYHLMFNGGGILITVRSNRNNTFHFVFKYKEGLLVFSSTKAADG